MKPDQERVKTLLSQTVVLLCKNGLHFEKELRIEGLIGITVDHESVFIVHINESLADFATDNAAAPFSTENCNDVMEMTKLKKSSTSGTEADAGKASIPDEVSRPFVSDVMSNSQELNVGKEEPLLNDDVTEIKAELDSEAEADDVVLVESDAEQDVENAAETHLATGALEVSNPASRRNFRNRFHPETFPRNKRRRLALPAPVNNTPSSISDRNYAMKIEPVSSPYLGSHQEQNMVYDDSYSEQKWENSDSMFGCTDRGVAEDLPGCSSWEGFDHQPREMTSADSFPQNNETYHESWTYAKFERRGPTPLQSAFNRTKISSPGDSIAVRQGSTVANYRRSRGGSTVKTVVCQYPDCGKTFCHSYHLYRHQREKHGRRFGVISQTSFMCRFPECGRVFYRIASLWNHEGSVHNVAPSDN